MSEARMSQSKMILRHMMDCGSITTWEAYEDYGCTKKNRYGRNVSFAKYTLGGNG